MDRLSAVLCLVAQVCLILCDAMDCSPPGSSVHGDSPGKNWSGLPWPPSGDLPNPGVEPRSPTLSADSLLTEPAGKLKKLEWVAIPSPGVIPDPGIKLESPALQADSLPAEPVGKPKYTGVRSLSLLQGIFQTQESNWSLLHCTRILYQLNHQGAAGFSVAWGYIFRSKLIAMFLGISWFCILSGKKHSLVLEPEGYFLHSNPGSLPSCWSWFTQFD